MSERWAEERHLAQGDRLIAETERRILRQAEILAKVASSRDEVQQPNGAGGLLAQMAGRESDLRQYEPSIGFNEILEHPGPCRYAAVSGGPKDTIEVIKWDIVDRDTGAWNIGYPSRPI